MLIVSMIILLVMSLLAIQGMQTATLEEKMAGNFRDKKIAFEAAETALLAAEAWIAEQTQAPLATEQGGEGVLIFGAAGLASPSLWDNDKPWVHRVANAEQYFPTMQAPRWIIEERQTMSGSGGNAEAGSVSQSSSNSNVHRYRITAAATGTTVNSIVVLQSHYERTF